MPLQDTTITNFFLLVDTFMGFMTASLDWCRSSDWPAQDDGLAFMGGFTYVSRANDRFHALRARRGGDAGWEIRNRDLTAWMPTNVGTGVV
jgi:hypothetical protein